MYIDIMKYTTKLWGRLTKQDRERMAPLKLGANSGFGLMLDNIIVNDPKRTFVSFAWYRNKLVGWSYAIAENKTTEVGVYVAKCHRRKGIGTALILKATRRAKYNTVRCFLHSNQAKKFYVQTFGAVLYHLKTDIVRSRFSDPGEYIRG